MQHHAPTQRAGGNPHGPERLSGRSSGSYAPCRHAKTALTASSTTFCSHRGRVEDLQTARDGTQEPLMLSIGALPSERAAPNSQRRGPKRALRLWPSARVVVLLPRCRKQPGVGTPEPAGPPLEPVLHTQPFGLGCPCFASSRPRYRGPLPHWDVVVHFNSLLLAPAGKGGCLACSVCRIVPLQELGGSASNTIALCRRHSLTTLCFAQPTAACGQRSADAGGLLAPGHIVP